MPLNNLPSSIQDIIQTGLLERRFGEFLKAKLGFRAIADQEPFMANIGETITKTRGGLLPAITTPLSPASNTDLTSGLTPQQWATEQYILQVAQYAANAQTNVVTSRVAIASVFMQNVKVLAEQAYRSVDTIAENVLFGSYMGGNTRVRVTLGAAGTTVSVDDIRGFISSYNTMGQTVPVSGTYPLVVTVGADVYSLVGATPDGSNVSTTPNGTSGVLTFSSNVSVSDGTSGNTVVSALAPVVIRPSLSSSGAAVGNTSLISSANDINGGKVTAQMILTAKATLSANGVPPGPNGNYIGYFDPVHLTGLYQDPAFQFFFRGQDNSSEWRKGKVSELLGVDIVETNLNPVQNLAGVGVVRRGIVAGGGALIEGAFTRSAYAESLQIDDDPMISIVDGIAHITREPIDALKQVMTQSWSWIGGFVCPTDMTANPSTLPSASNSALKRAVVLESL